MSSFGLIVVIVLVIGRGTGSTVICPSVGCQCQSDDVHSFFIVSVSCVDANLTDLPMDLLSRTPSLVSLHLTGNSVGHLKRGSVPSLPHLTDLQLRSNGIQSLDESVFEGCTKVKSLDLSINNLTVLSSNAFRGLAELLHLDLSANRLERIDGSLLELEHLARLDLRQNHLSKISEETFRGLSRLRYLRLDNNRIQYIHSASFIHLKNLFYLVLKSNPIHGQPRFLFSTGSLSYLDLSNCNLSSVPIGLPSSVEYLHLGANNISFVRQIDFALTTEIKILVLDDNGLVAMETGAMATMEHLQQLWLNGNQLTTIPRPLPIGLQRLFIDHNAIRQLTSFHFLSSSSSSSFTSTSLSSSSSLSSLSLMGNQLERISSQVFRQLPQLNLLDLSGNRLTSLPRNAFVANRRMQTLLLSRNPLRLFHSDCFRGLSSLLTLSLSFVAPNKVSLHNNVFSSLTRLRKLDMDSSPQLTRSFLSSSAASAGSSGFQPLVHLQELSARNTDLTRLPPDFPVIFCHLSVLRISSDRWQCDEGIAWLRDWLRSTQSESDPKDNICGGPALVSGRSVMTITDLELQNSSGLKVKTSAEKNDYVKVTPDAARNQFIPRGSLTKASRQETISVTPEGNRLLTWSEFMASVRARDENRQTKEEIVTQKVIDTTLATGYDVIALRESGNSNCRDCSMEEQKNVEMVGMAETAAAASLLLMLVTVLVVVIFLVTRFISTSGVYSQQANTISNAIDGQRFDSATTLLSVSDDLIEEERKADEE